MHRKTLIQTLALAAATGSLGLAHAQAPVEVPFYYPVAVGGAVAIGVEKA